MVFRWIGKVETVHLYGFNNLEFAVPSLIMINNFNSFNWYIFARTCFLIVQRNSSSHINLVNFSFKHSETFTHLLNEDQSLFTNLVTLTYETVHMQKLKKFSEYFKINLFSLSLKQNYPNA